MSCSHDDSNNRDPNKASSQDAQYSYAGSSTGTPLASLVESPDRRKELRQSDRANNNGVTRESQVIELHRWRQPMMPERIFATYLWRVEKAGVRDEVRDEAQDVDSWEIDGRACRRLSAEVENRLRVEGERPANGVDPAEQRGYRREERSCHFRQQDRVLRHQWKSA